MSTSVAIIADDLTGALDSSTPFVLRGHEVAVACVPEAVSVAVATGAAVVAVNTASRAVSRPEAAAVVRRCALALAGFDVAFKKVDSRLKGNVAAEVAAALPGFGRSRALILPAVPSEGRLVAGGAIVGRGVDVPIDIRARLAAVSSPIDLPDTADQPAMLPFASRLVADGQLLGVGARGLAQALAAALPPGTSAVRRLRATTSIVFAIGSRDPITVAAIDCLLREFPATASVPAPDGELAHFPGTATPITLLHMTRGERGVSEAEAGARFARGVTAFLADKRDAAVVLCGGDTAQGVLGGLGVRVVRPQGEAHGLPWFEVERPGGRLTVLTKSGGFGGPGVFAGLVRELLRV